MQRRPLELEELELLERNATPRERLLLFFLYESGCTVSELVKVRRSHLKGSMLLLQRRRIKLSSYLLQQLKRDGGTPFLFSSREARIISPRRVEQLLSALGKRILGKSITPHQLRTSRIIHDFLNRVPVKEIEQKIGIKTIEPYIYKYYSGRWTR